MNIHKVCLKPVWPKCDHAYSKRVISGLASGLTRSLTLKEVQRSEGSVSAFVILGNRHEQFSKLIDVPVLLLVMSRNF
jgi:hypothetical protein